MESMRRQGGSTIELQLITNIYSVNNLIETIHCNSKYFSLDYMETEKRTRRGKRTIFYLVADYYKDAKIEIQRVNPPKDNKPFRLSINVKEDANLWEFIEDLKRDFLVYINPSVDVKRVVLFLKEEKHYISHLYRGVADFSMVGALGALRHIANFVYSGDVCFLNKLDKLFKIYNILFGSISENLKKRPEVIENLALITALKNRTAFEKVRAMLYYYFKDMSLADKATYYYLLGIIRDITGIVPRRIDNKEIENFSSIVGKLLRIFVEDAYLEHNEEKLRILQGDLINLVGKIV